MQKLFIEKAMLHFQNNKIRNHAEFMISNSMEFFDPIFIENIGVGLIDAQLLKIDLLRYRNASLTPCTRFISLYRLYMYLAGVAYVRRNSIGIGSLPIQAGQIFSEVKALNSRVYKICIDFSEDLFVTDLHLPNEMILASMYSGEAIFIDFTNSQHFLTADGHTLTCAVVTMVGESLTSEPGEHKLLFSFPELDSNDRYTSTSNYACVNLNKFSDFSDSIDECLGVSLQSNLPKEVLEFSAKCLLYLKSGEPDLRDGREPLLRRPWRQKRRLTEGGGGEDLFRVTYVGYNYADRFVGPSITSVIGHPRWQPCGPGRTERKWVWVRPHARHFKGSREVEMNSLIKESEVKKVAE